MKTSNTLINYGKNKWLQFAGVIIATLISPFNATAQLPNLGTAENFVVFTTIGALDNTATSLITGNIGTNDGPIAGFLAPTIVNGSIEWQNAATGQCALDVQAAYAQLFAIAPTTLHAPAFGSGETVFAGVYAIGSAGSVAGTLVLDAQGNPNAMFLFRFLGSFTTEASTTIKLINNASPCNVFWIADGAIIMAASTEMKGTLIADNGEVSLGAGGNLEGRMLSTSGAATLYKVLATLPNCLVDLPIKLVSFTGRCENKNLLLAWKTATEINNDFFTAERSHDGIAWQTVGTVTGAGNSSTEKNYELIDPATNKEATYYRLKQTDFNGEYTYGDIIHVSLCEENSENLSISPNPNSGKFELLFNGDRNEINAIEIFNVQGQKVYSGTGFQSDFDLSNHVSGTYFVRIHRNKSVTNLKILLYN